MKSQMYIVALPLLAVVAFAQSTAPQGQTPATPDSKATSGPPAPNSNSAPAMQMTRNYSGTLMDVSCATGASATTPAADSGKPTAETTGAKTAAGGPSCSVTATSTQFAIKLKDGQIVKLDDVGNQRVQEGLKAKKKWSEAAASGKAIHVDASGVLTGDKLVALSIN